VVFVSEKERRVAPALLFYFGAHASIEVAVVALFPTPHLEISIAKNCIGQGSSNSSVFCLSNPAWSICYFLEISAKIMEFTPYHLLSEDRRLVLLFVKSKPV
jgi:hypothetical protein